MTLIQHPRPREQDTRNAPRGYPTHIYPVNSFKFRRRVGREILDTQIWPVNEPFYCPRLEVNLRVLRDVTLTFHRMPGHNPTSWRVSFEGRYSGMRLRTHGEVVVFDDELEVVRFS